MESNTLIQKKLHDEKETINIKLKKIAANVWDVCCFGGENLSKPKEVTAVFISLMDSVYKLKNILTNFETLNISKEDKQRLQQSVSNFRSSNGCFGIPLNQWGKYFQPSRNKSVYINPSVIPIILKSMCQMIGTKEDANKLDFYTNFQKLKTYEPSDFQPFLSLLTYHWINKDRSQKNKEAIKVGELYSSEKMSEPKNKKDRMLLIQYMVNDIAFGPSYFGMGNCQLMADLAFLLAIQTLPTTPIRYVQFHHSESKCEELNAIVVGDWPKPSCLVLAPWYSQDPFEWKGSLDNTPEINHYDTTSTLFTVKTPQEQIDLKNLLKDSDFNLEKLLNNPNRANYLKYIKNKCQAIYEICQGNDKPDCEEKTKVSMDI